MKVIFAFLFLTVLAISNTSFASEFDTFSRKLFVRNGLGNSHDFSYNLRTRKDRLRNLSLLYYQVETAQFKEALSKLSAIKQAVLQGDNEVKGTYYLVLSRLNFRIGNTGKAINLNERAIDLLKKSSSLETLQLAYCNQAFFFTISNENKAIVYFDKADELRKNGIKTYEVLYFSNKTFHALITGNIANADANCTKALLVEKQLSDHSLVDQYRIFILQASIAEVKGDFNQEDQSLKEAKKLAMESNIIDNWKQVANSQSVNAFQKGNIKEAYSLLLEQDSLQNLIPNKEISEYLLQMELDEQMKIEKAEKQLVQNELENKKSQFVMILCFSIFLSVVLIVILLQRNWLKLTRKSLMQQHIQQARKTDLSNELKSTYIHLIDKIETLMNDKELFSDSNLTLDRLAKKLGTNRTYLSECINDYYQLNYSQWIAKLRIEAAKRYFLDENFENWSIEGVSQTVGFASISSFNATFKRETGLTPSQFRKLSK